MRGLYVKANTKVIIKIVVRFFFSDQFLTVLLAVCLYVRTVYGQKAHDLNAFYCAHIAKKSPRKEPRISVRVDVVATERSPLWSLLSQVYQQLCRII